MSSPLISTSRRMRGHFYTAPQARGRLHLQYALCHYFAQGRPLISSDQVDRAISRQLVSFPNSEIRTRYAERGQIVLLHATAELAVAMLTPLMSKVRASVLIDFLVNSAKEGPYVDRARIQLDIMLSCGANERVLVPTFSVDRLTNEEAADGVEAAIELVKMVRAACGPHVVRRVRRDLRRRMKATPSIAAEAVLVVLDD